MKVGVPTEIKSDEYRVALTPAGVRELMLHEHSVVVQAESFHNGKLLAGSPVTLVVPIRGTVPR